jgi:hypothetical protein
MIAANINGKKYVKSKTTPSLIVFKNLRRRLRSFFSSFSFCSSSSSITSWVISIFSVGFSSITPLIKLILLYQLFEPAPIYNTKIAKLKTTQTGDIQAKQKLGS